LGRGILAFFIFGIPPGGIVRKNGKGGRDIISVGGAEGGGWNCFFAYPPVASRFYIIIIVYSI
jgi:hypothetical protein